MLKRLPNTAGPRISPSKCQSLDQEYCQQGFGGGIRDSQEICVCTITIVRQRFKKNSIFWIIKMEKYFFSKYTAYPKATYKHAYRLVYIICSSNS